MHLPFSIYLALKYLKPKRTFLSVVTVISVLGVMLGVAVLIIVLSVMSGFDNMWRDKILGFNSHVTIEAMGPMHEYETVLATVTNTSGVRAAAPYVQGLVFVQVDDRVGTPLVRGVDVDLERTVSKVPEEMLEGKFSVEDDEVVLGVDLARQIGVQTGQTILVHSPRSFADPDELYLPEELTVSGIFELGMWEFDVGFVFTSMDTARSLCGLNDGISALQVMTDDPLDMTDVSKALKNALEHGYLVRTWEDMNRPLFAALRVEKNLMFVLLLCITLVAAFSITNTLITIVVQKTSEIGLLKSIGFSPGAILRVFVWHGVIYGILGTVCGLVLGLTTLHFLNDLLGLLNRSVGYEMLPKNLYHLDKIPVATSPHDILLVVVSVLVICTLAGLIPAYSAAKLEPSRALRYE